MEHRHIEAAAVPGHELRGVFRDAVEEPLNERASPSVSAPMRPHAEAVAVAQRARDGDDAVQVQREEVAAGRLPAQRERHLGDFPVAQPAVEAVQAAQTRDVGDRLYVESQDRRHLRIQVPLTSW